MANKHEGLNSLFTDIANAIRTKTKKTESIVADNFPDEIKTITLGSGDAVVSDVKEGKTFSNDSGVHTGTFAAEEITVSSNDTYTPSTGKYLSSVDVNVHVDVGTSSQVTTGSTWAQYNYSDKCVFVLAGGGGWVHGSSSPNPNVTFSCSGDNVVQLSNERGTQMHCGDNNNIYGAYGCAVYYCPSGGTATVWVNNLNGLCKCWVMRIV